PITSKFIQDTETRNFYRREIARSSRPARVRWEWQAEYSRCLPRGKVNRDGKRPWEPRPLISDAVVSINFSFRAASRAPSLAHLFSYRVRADCRHPTLATIGRAG